MLRIGAEVTVVVSSGPLTDVVWALVME